MKKSTKNITKKEKPKKEKKVKKTKKESKTVKYKKFPSIFKKKYTEKSLNKKLLSKIYIPEDQKLIKDLFQAIDNPNTKKKVKYGIPKDKEVDTKTAKKLKILAKEIKVQKGSIKLMPLLAVIILLTTVIVLFVSTKNIIIKKQIKNFCEYEFEAKCDIGYLDFKIFGPSFTIRNFTIADKDRPMQNIFSFDSLVVDFNLTQLLKAKFVAEDLSIDNVAVESKREYSGELSKVKLRHIQAKKAKKNKKANKEIAKEQSAIEKGKKEPSAFQQALQNAPSNFLKNADNSLFDAFKQYDPKAIIEGFYENLKIPEVAKEIEENTLAIIDKWKKTPDEITQKVENIRKSTESLINYNYDSIKNNPIKVKEVIELLVKSIKDVENLKIETEKLTEGIKTDFNTVNNLSQSVKTSVEHDLGLVKLEIDKISNFQFPSGQEFLTATIDNYGYMYLDKYYPLAQKGLNFLIDLKEKQAVETDKTKKEKRPKKEKAPKKKKITRAAGRDVYFSEDRNPRFWIKNASGSGHDVEVFARNISSNMDITKEVAEIGFKLKYDGLAHDGGFVIDIRTGSKAPLVALEYNCVGAKFDASHDIPGLPQFVTKADFNAFAKFYEDAAFEIAGNS